MRSPINPPINQNNNAYHLLVDQMSQELGGGETDALVVSAVSSPELEDKSLQDQLAYLGELKRNRKTRSGIGIVSANRANISFKYFQFFLIFFFFFFNSKNLEIQNIFLENFFY